MARASARSLWFASVALVLCTVVFASDGAPLPKRLEQRDLANPEVISKWLRAHAATAQRELADRLYVRAQKDKKRGAWGPAGKGFAESALFYPSPKSLSEYAYAATRSLGHTRFREKSFSDNSRADMEHIASLYRSAIAADEVLNTLSAKEKLELRRNVDCLAAFLQTGKPDADCQPLQSYGLN